MHKKWLVVISIAMLLTVGCANEEKQEVSNVSYTEEVDDSIEVSGKIKANKIREVSIDFPATVEEIYVLEGDKLEKGQEILALNYEEYKDEIKQKEQDLELEKLALKKLKGIIETTTVEINSLQKEINQKQNLLDTGEDGSIKIIKGQIALAEQVLEVAEKKYADSKAIYEAGGISAKELEELEMDVNAKQKDKEELEASMEKTLLEKNLEIDKLKDSKKAKEMELDNSRNDINISIKQEELTIKKIELELQTMKKKLEQTYIQGNKVVSDMDLSVIYDITAQRGSSIGGNQKATNFKLMDLSTIVATVDIPEEFISKVKIGTKAEVTIYTDDSKTYTGQIVRLSEMAVEESGETIIKADIVLDDIEKVEKIVPGLTVEAKLYS